MGKIERTLKRLRIVYYILLIVIGISIYQTLGPALRSASLKSEQSRDMLDVDNLSLQEPGKELFVSSDSAIQIRLSGFQANIRKGTEALRPWELIVMGAARIVGVLGFLIFLLIFVYSLYTITRSIFRKDIFNKRTIITCKLLALFWLITFWGGENKCLFRKTGGFAGFGYDRLAGGCAFLFLRKCSNGYNYLYFCRGIIRRL